MSSAFHAHALGALAEVAGPGLDFHLVTVLPPLLSAMGGDDEVDCTEPIWRKFLIRHSIFILALV